MEEKEKTCVVNSEMKLRYKRSSNIPQNGKDDGRFLLSMKVESNMNLKVNTPLGG